MQFILSVVLERTVRFAATVDVKVGVGRLGGGGGARATCALLKSASANNKRRL